MTQWFFLATMAPMLRSGFVTLLFIFAPLFVTAQSLQQRYIEQFQSSRLEMPPEDSPYFRDNPGRYPGLLALLYDLIGWVPTGKGPGFSAPCSPHTWQSRMNDPRIASSVHMQGALLQKYFQQCQSDLETGKNGEFINALKMLTMKYDPQGHPFLRRVILNLPGNIKLKGLLGLKGDSKPRPFVIFRLGIFANVEGFLAERAWLMMLFEQSPFNILVVENITGSDFVMNNSRLAFGGYDEGIQNIHIAKLLQDPLEPISSLVQSVHLLGISLGGHGVLNASLLNKYNSSGAKPLIRSFFAFCPVVDLQKSLQHLTQSSVSSKFIDIWAERRLAQLKRIYPELKDAPAFKFLETAIQKVIRIYNGGLSYVSSVKLPPGVQDSSDFWKMNNFWQHYDNVKEPVLILATRNDSVVPYKLNAETLHSRELKVNSKNIKVIEMAQGWHCTLPVVYQWEAIAGTLQSYVLSHSPEFEMREQVLDFDMVDDWGEQFLNSAKVIDFAIEWPKRTENFVSVIVTAENQDRKEKEFTISLPLSEFDFRFLNDQMTKSEQQMVTRWLNQNLRIGLKDKKLQMSWWVAK